MLKPMLAAPVDFDKLKFPCYASPKLDGIRAIVQNGVVLSRSLTPIPNRQVQRMFGAYEHFDGELIVGSPTAEDVFRNTTSHVMSFDKEDADLRYYVFDHLEAPHERFHHRSRRVTQANLKGNVFPLGQFPMNKIEELLAYEEACLDAGYEGIIVRDPDAPYKFGRSTANEGYLLKLKRFTDAEFPIIGFEERMHNGNEATVSNLGRTKRSSHTAGKSGRGDLGALVLALPDGRSFNCGTGFDDELRRDVWHNQKRFLGRLAKVKFFQIGMKDAPRHPTFLGFRDKSDL